MIWIIAVVLFFVAYVFYNQWTWSHSYWDFRGMPGPHPLPIVGNIFQILLGLKSLGDLGLVWSRKFKDTPLVGFYSFLKPCVLVNRADYAETVSNTNFSNFFDRHIPRSCNINSSDRLLHLTTGATWKHLRSKIGPAYTVEKIKEMTLQIKTCSENVLNHIDENISTDIPAKDIIDSYVLGVAAKLVYAIDFDTTSNHYRQFAEHCKKMNETSLFSTWKKIIYINFPKLAYYLQIPLIPGEHVLFFKRVLEQAFRERKASGSKRNDIVQLLLELKETGSIEIENTNHPENELLVPPQNIGPIETVDVTDDMLASQALLFLTTGLETTTSALASTLVEICQSPDTVDRLVKEIETVMQKHNELNYDALKDMNFLEMCIKEGLRLHPVMSALNRCCTRNYTFDNGLQVVKRVMMTIPVLAFHSDPKHYSEPEKFNPQRFSTPPLPGTYFGFGDGFRSCIAKNLAMVEMKMILAQLFLRYNIKMSHRTVLPIATDKRNFISKPTSPIYFSMTKRSKM